MIYLDSAAIVKLAHAEAESGALRDWLDQRAELDWVSSVLEIGRASCRERVLVAV